MDEEKKVIGNDTPLTESEVFDVLNFAQAYYKTQYGQYGMGGFTPYLANERLKEIGLMPRDATKQDLQRNFNDPLGSSDSMVGYSEFLQFTESVAKRTMLYLGNLPSFDYTFVCTNIDTDNEYASELYKQDYNKVKNFLNKFDVKGQFAYVSRRLLTSDAFYAVFRTDGNENYEFQELPADRCLITGRNLDWGYIFDFDMGWFLQQGLSINMYPRNFKPIWRRVFGNVTDVSQLKYDPANPLDKRKGTYSTWAQTSPLPKYGNFVCFKFNSDIYAVMPYLSAMFSDAINKPLLRELQNNQYIIASQKLLVGLIPLLKEQKSGQVADALAIKYDTLGKFLGLLKQGLSDAIKVGGVPFSDLKDISFPQQDRSIYNEYNSNLSRQSGATGALVYGSDRPTATELLLSSQIDAMIATSIYPQMAKWLSTMVNTLTDHYKFKFKFEGNNFDSSRQQRLDTAMKLADKGMVLPQKLAAALGMNIFEFEEQLRMGKASNLIDKLWLLPNANTNNMGEESVSGRPKKSVTEASESTLNQVDRDVEV